MTRSGVQTNMEPCVSWWLTLWQPLCQDSIQNTTVVWGVDWFGIPRPPLRQWCDDLMTDCAAFTLNSSLFLFLKLREITARHVWLSVRPGLIIVDAADIVSWKWIITAHGAYSSKCRKKVGVLVGKWFRCRFRQFLSCSFCECVAVWCHPWFRCCVQTLSSTAQSDQETTSPQPLHCLRTARVSCFLITCSLFAGSTIALVKKISTCSSCCSFTLSRWAYQRCHLIWCTSITSRNVKAVIRWVWSLDHNVAGALFCRFFPWKWKQNKFFSQE